MKVNAEACWTGHDHYWRLEFEHRGETRRLSVACNERGTWDRDTATRALNLLDTWFSVSRKSVRFNVH